MRKTSKKKKLLAAAAGLALIAVVSGTFAWITSQDQRINRASSAAVNDNSVTVIEKWEPKPLVPGTEATKEVAVANTGTANVFVRVSYEEVLKHLSGLGEEKYAPSQGEGAVEGAKYVYVENDPGLNKHMPISFNGKQAYDDGFLVVPTDHVNGLEENTKLLVKGGKTVDEVTGAETINYEAKLMYEYYTDPENAGKNPGDPGYKPEKNKYQSMKFNISVNNENDSKNAKDWNFTLADVKYGYYENGYKNTVVNWAKSSLPNEAGEATGSALLGTKGIRYSVNYDYRSEALGLEKIPDATPTTNNDQIPTGAGPKGVQADASGLSQSHIRIGYSADVTDITESLASKKWVYNSEDGWFYYTSPLKSGETSPKLLEKLIFESSMGKEYNNASYDLAVKMEAIQATPEALKDNAGWGLKTSDEQPNTKKIYEKLIAE